jgi:hypothetical protein
MARGERQRRFQIPPALPPPTKLEESQPSHGSRLHGLSVWQSEDSQKAQLQGLDIAARCTSWELEGSFGVGLGGAGFSRAEPWC